MIENQKYAVHPKLLFSKLQNNVEFVVFQSKDLYEPFFFKNKIIHMLIDLKSINTTLNDLKIFYNISEEEINCLIKLNILIPYLNKSKNDLPEINFHSKTNIIKLSSLAVTTRTPLFCKIELTYKCNFNCKHCYIKNCNSDFINFKDLKRILYDLKSIGVLFIFLTGGEPMLHPKINEILKLCDEHGFITVLQTNASLITENHIKFFRKLNHFKIGISYHSDDSEEFDYFTQTPGSFFKITNVIEKLKNSDLDYFLKIPVTIFNYKKIVAIAKKFEEENIKIELNTQILPDIADKDEIEYLQPDKLDYLIPLYKSGLLLFTKTQCSACKDKLWINPSGEVFPCELYRHSIGNVFEENIKTLWYSDKALKILNSSIYQEIELCNNCEIKCFCNKCLAYYDYKKWNNPLVFFCKKAKIIADLMKSNNLETSKK
jgi:MoaA/NifB/PqqE/SkfB family radical SAM enzyme